MQVMFDKKVIDYYKSIESRLTYFCLKGIKHFGYFPQGHEDISVASAQRLMIEKVFNKLELKSDFILDAGCGEGETICYLANKFNIKGVGIDILDFNIRRANKKKIKFGISNQVKFQVMDYADTNFGDQTFDAIITMESLVHTPDYKKALKEFHRILKPGGKWGLLEYTIAPVDKFPLDLRPLMNIIIQRSGMHSLPYFLHGKLTEILKDSRFSVVSEENVTANVVPMFRKTYPWVCLPYKLVKTLKLQKHFVNIVSAAEGFLNFIPFDLWRENIIIGQKI